ncbi:hypothetical protein LG943_12345 [Streptomonospora sp. S1-112]|uniref:Uncharacterized protein n=1 Tax=Streptomonospora mangrovi TaxID=2883123 RepID=A0A9X3NNM5_9ACTN|nr:hypothetical protein [Streptomonospora mangrovi]MDA0565104.1 hypothetical protein [Streptomonospora mangrovi]
MPCPHCGGTGRLPWRPREDAPLPDDLAEAAGAGPDAVLGPPAGRRLPLGPKAAPEGVAKHIGAAARARRAAGDRDREEVGADSGAAAASGTAAGIAAALPGSTLPGTPLPGTALPGTTGSGSGRSGAGAGTGAPARRRRRGTGSPAGGAPHTGDDAASDEDSLPSPADTRAAAHRRAAADDDPFADARGRVPRRPRRLGGAAPTATPFQHGLLHAVLGECALDARGVHGPRSPLHLGGAGQAPVPARPRTEAGARARQAGSSGSNAARTRLNTSAPGVRAG